MKTRHARRARPRRTVDDAYSASRQETRSDALHAAQIEERREVAASVHARDETTVEPTRGRIPYQPEREFNRIGLEGGMGEPQQLDRVELRPDPPLDSTLQVPHAAKRADAPLESELGGPGSHSASANTRARPSASACSAR